MIRTGMPSTRSKFQSECTRHCPILRFWLHSSKIALEPGQVKKLLDISLEELLANANKKNRQAQVARR